MLAAIRSPSRRSALADNSEVSPSAGNAPLGRAGVWACTKPGDAIQIIAINAIGTREKFLFGLENEDGMKGYKLGRLRSGKTVQYLLRLDGATQPLGCLPSRGFPTRSKIYLYIL